MATLPKEAPFSFDLEAEVRSSQSASPDCSLRVKLSLTTGDWHQPFDLPNVPILCDKSSFRTLWVPVGGLVMDFSRCISGLASLVLIAVILRQEHPNHWARILLPNRIEKKFLARLRHGQFFA